MKPIRMRAATLGALACVSTAGIANATSAFNAPVDVAAIKALETKLQTETNMKKLIGDYAEDAQVLDIYTPGVYHGHKEIDAAFTPQLAVVKSLKPGFSEMNVAADGKFACAMMQIHFDTVLKDGKTFTMALRELDAFKKIDGKWKLVQQHVSLPVDPKTGMAVTAGPIVAQGSLTWSANPLPGPAGAVEQSKKEIRDWMDIGGASTNLDQLMQYYGPGDDVIVYDNFYPGELRGITAIRDNYAQMMGGIQDSKLQMPMFQVDTDGSFGIQIDTQELKLTLKDGSTKFVSLRQSDCMRRVEGKWYTFFEMISFPIDMKSSQAVMENPGAFH
jgi:ketosteroid isomerase-like protein